MSDKPSRDLGDRPRLRQGRLVKASLTQMNKQGHPPEMWWAQASAAEGDRERAIEWLQKAVANQDTEFAFAVRDPIFDFVRSDRRYVELIRGVGLPP